MSVSASCLAGCLTQNCLAGLRGGSTFSPAGYEKQLLSLDLGTGEEINFQDPNVRVTRPAVTHLQAEPHTHTRH